MHCAKIRYVLAGLLIIARAAATAAGHNISITDFGAVGDAVTLNTKSIQAAVDRLAADGGGTVYFPPGRFLSGTIYLKSHVQLHLESGAVLLGSRDVNDYPLTISRYPSGSDRYVARALIWGEDLTDIAITGPGAIDGQGPYFARNLVPQPQWQKLISVFTDSTRFPPEPFYINRPYMLRFISCQLVRIENVTLRKPAMWLQQYLNCEQVTIRDVEIFSHGSPNNDLIDIDGSRDVVISGCRGDSDDDGITLKSTSAAPVQNVVISDCIIRTRTNAIKAGTESSGGFKDITITNCVLKKSLVDSGYSGRAEGLAGIALEIVDGGTLDRVTISNIAIEDMAAPIFLRLGNRARPFRVRQQKPPVGTFRNVKISNITATNAGRNGCSILGIKDHYIENVSISNVYIHFDGGGSKTVAEAEYPENDADYPESTRYGDLPAYGFYCRHVDGLVLRDIKLAYDVAEARPPLFFDDVKNLDIFHFQGQVDFRAASQMRLRACQNVSISECSPQAMPVFMRLEKHCDRIRVMGNNLVQVQKPFEFDETMNMSAVDVAGNLPADRPLISFLEPLINRGDDGYVTMRSFTTDSQIHYTLDGAEVTPQSQVYSQPFLQMAACSLKARVFKNGMASAVAELKLSAFQTRPPEVKPNHSFFHESVQIALSCATPNAEIRYSLDKHAPVSGWSVYENPFLLKKSAVLYAQALKAGYGPSEIVTSINEQIPRQGGVLYKYYLGDWDRLPNLLDMQPARSGWIRQFRLEEVAPRTENYALLMIGYVRVTKAGYYIFHSGSNDGSQLYIDNVLLIDNDGYHGYEEVAGRIYLNSGRHQVQVRYFQKGGSQQLKISWQGSDFAKQEISMESLQ
jgi:polygalacturonase